MQKLAQMLKQKSIRRPVNAIGIGVHSGKTVRMTLRPAGENTGILFVRTDVIGPAGRGVSVRADTLNVSDTTLATTLSESGVRVATVEHLMSALWGLGIDNLLVELSDEEVPIMDGSAAPYIHLLHSAGVVEQQALRQFIRVKRPVEVRDGDAIATLVPYDGFKAGYTFVADHPVYDRYPKQVQCDFNDVSYERDIGQARSFGLIDDLEKARAMHRCLGSSLDNAVGIDGNRVLNEGGLRYQDEFVKHKLLDAIGDLYLLGRPLLGEFSGVKSGHSLNNRLARELLRCPDAWELSTYHGPEAFPAVNQMAVPAAV
jgi:UDP-3-O-[3-hydroxymyristoyl] N-acetylglucosamine deacetylase